MKIYFFLVLILLFSIFSFGQSNEKESILILSVNFHTTTIISVPCENFNIQFEGQIKINKVNAKDSIAILDKFLKSVRFFKNGREINVDTRAKIIYKNKIGKEVIICTNGVNLLINGSVVRKNKSFLKFVLSLIPEEQQTIHRSRPKIP